MSENKKIPERKRLAALFASFAIVVGGALSLLETMSFDYYSVLGTIQKIVPASIIMGCLGWVMGMILDKPKKRHKMSYNNMFLKEIVKSTRLNTPASTESEPAETTEEQK